MSKALHLHGIFGDIVNDLIDMAIRQALIAPIANSLFPAAGGGSGTGGGGGSGFFGSLISGIGSALGIGGAASSLTRFVGGAHHALGKTLEGLPGLAGALVVGQ